MYIHTHIQSRPCVINPKLSLIIPNLPKSQEDNFQEFDQQLANFDQKSEKFDQQSEKFNQKSEKFDRKSEKFDQKSEKFDQKSENSESEGKEQDKEGHVSGDTLSDRAHRFGCDVVPGHKLLVEGLYEQVV